MLVVRRYYKINVEEFAKRFKKAIEVKPTIIPCLSPDEMRCKVCGHSVADEIDWDHYTLTGEILCISCVE